MTSPEVSIVAPSAPGIVASVRDLWRYREVVWAFASRLVRLKYKQTLFGVVWVVLQPMIFLVSFVVVFGRLGRIGGGGAPYAAFALSSLVPWQFVSNAVGTGVGSLLGEAGLIRKVYFPRESPVLGAILATTIDLAIGLAFAVALMPFLGGRLTWTVVWIPAFIAMLMFVVVAIALPLAACNVYYRDFRYLLPIALQLWLFLSPVAYPLTKVSPGWRLFWAVANPVVGPLDGFRRALTLGQGPDLALLAGSGAGALFLFSVGFALFKRLESDLADVI